MSQTIAKAKDNAMTGDENYDEIMLGNIKGELRTDMSFVIFMCNLYRYSPAGVTGMLIVRGRGKGKNMAGEIWITESLAPADKTTYYRMVYKR